MVDMLKGAGFEDIKIEVKENAAEIIKDWMPGSGAENFITSAYVTATKPKSGADIKDDVRANATYSDAALLEVMNKSADPCSPAQIEAGC